MRIHFVTVDVFTNKQFGGNPLAVVLDGQGLSSQQMQAIAGEFNLSETTFVLPPKVPAHAAEVRIFTQRAEMPFAGHPNVGTAFVLARIGESYGQPLNGSRFVFEEKAGLVWMDILRDGAAVTGARLAAPQLLTIGEEISPEMVAAACSIPLTEIDVSTHRPVVASCGNPFVFAELKSRGVLASARPNEHAFTQYFPINRIAGVHIYMRTHGKDADIQARVFAPLHGIPEDPATGSANVAFVGLLAALRSEPDLSLRLKIAQGVDMGRPSLLDAMAEKKNGVVTTTYIGGTCATMMNGYLDLA